MFSLLSPCWFFICGDECHRPPRYVPYKCTYVPYNGTFGMSDQGQMLDVWGWHPEDVNAEVAVTPVITTSLQEDWTSQQLTRQPPPHHERQDQQHSPPSPSPRPSPPRQQQPAPPPPQAGGERNYIPEQVGRCVYDSLKILGLGLGASERKIKLAYRQLACLYHPDKWEHAQATTGKTLEETIAHFQLLNNAQAFLRANL